MFRYLLILVFTLFTSCKGDVLKNSEISQNDEIDTAISIEKDTLRSAHVKKNPMLFDKEEIQVKKKLEKIKAENQLAMDIDKSNLKGISCEEIFMFYEKLILKAKETKDRIDIRKLNEYKSDPNFRICRKKPENKGIYNRLEKLKHKD